MLYKVQLIKEEIEEKLSNLWHLIPEGEKVLQDNFTKEDANNLGKYTALESLLQFIDSIPEPASEDLEEEIENYIKDSLAIKFPTIDKEQIKTDIRYIARHFAEWQKQQMKEALQTEYEKGKFDMREEMMKNAVETTIVNDWQYGKDPDYAIIPAIHQRINGFNVGDKVKIIIVKEEQQ